MKLSFLLSLSFCILVFIQGIWIQVCLADEMPRVGNATATHYDVGSAPRACNCKTGVNNYPSAALSQNYFGAGPGQGAGPACGRCYELRAVGDPYNPNSQVTSSLLVVKVVDLCPHAGNEQWCMATDQPNAFGYLAHFDLATPFADKWVSETGLGAWVIAYSEVDCTAYAGYADPNAYGTQTSVWGSCPQDPPFSFELYDGESE